MEKVRRTALALAAVASVAACGTGRGQSRGATGYGPRGDVATMLKEVPYLAPYLLYSYSKLYGPRVVPLDQIFQPRWMATFERDVTTKCIDEVPGYYPNAPRQLYQPAFAEVLDQNRLADAFPALKKALDQNNAGRAPGGAPLLVVEGLNDTLVPPATQQAFVRSACAAGVSVTYVTYPDIPHTMARQVSIEDVMAWMDGLNQGKPPRNDCGK